MMSSLSISKVTFSFCFASKIPDNPTTTTYCVVWFTFATVSFIDLTFIQSRATMFPLSINLFFVTSDKNYQFAASHNMCWRVDHYIYCKLLLWVTFSIKGGEVNNWLVCRVVSVLWQTFRHWGIDWLCHLSWQEQEKATTGVPWKIKWI